jgi:hypothetical protein
VRLRRPRVGSDTEKEINSYQIDPNTPVSGEEDTVEVTPTTARIPATRTGEKNSLAETINAPSIDISVKSQQNPLAQSINVENAEFEIDIEVETETEEKPVKSFTGTLLVVPLPRR